MNLELVDDDCLRLSQTTIVARDSSGYLGFGKNSALQCPLHEELSFLDAESPQRLFRDFLEQ